MNINCFQALPTVPLAEGSQLAFSKFYITSPLSVTQPGNQLQSGWHFHGCNSGLPRSFSRERGDARYFPHSPFIAHFVILRFCYLDSKFNSSSGEHLIIKWFCIWHNNQIHNNFFCLLMAKFTFKKLLTKWHTSNSLINISDCVFNNLLASLHSILLNILMLM